MLPYTEEKIPPPRAPRFWARFLARILTRFLARFLTREEKYSFAGSIGGKYSFRVLLLPHKYSYTVLLTTYYTLFIFLFLARFLTRFSIVFFCQVFDQKIQCRVLLGQKIQCRVPPGQRNTVLQYYLLFTT